MNGTRPPQEEPVPSEQVRAEAAAWVAQLHDEQRSPHLEARVHAWLGESEDHRRAFNRMTHVWERSGLIQMRAQGDVSTTRTEPRPRVTSRAVTLAATLVVPDKSPWSFLVPGPRWVAVATTTGPPRPRTRPRP